MADDVGIWWWSEASRCTTHMVDFIEVQIKVICGGTLKSWTCRFDLQRQMSRQYGYNTTNLQPLLYEVRAGTLLSRYLNLCTHSILPWSYSATCWLYMSKIQIKRTLWDHYIQTQFPNPVPGIPSPTHFSASQLEHTHFNSGRCT